MKEVIKGFRKIVYLSFPPEASGRPVICNLTRLFDLNFNILKADISPRHLGSMTLEVSGMEEDFHKGISYLKENGIRITPVAHKIFRNEESCVHCGLCTAMCPTDALSLEMSTRKVIFDVEKCSACGMCTRICPVKAMTLDLDENK
ncbi:4Fe-4S dicluster domain-containing protein [Pseudodesulfovibrio cashew]|uniref:4Fe-4S dicluster domain-containing protein n=1 Tax=Pseudodesulfovibrio cashew TaxID=2678688 RepID=A0A6I6JJB6_9BACT|nr:NIL domain-containing protein [Pseudodesulfovibrio cashew]QGY41229.1 4Fe-4S dicluster domain-containing protein [Pseudodesulfovibrio cashew]